MTTTIAAPNALPTIMLRDVTVHAVRQDELLAHMFKTLEHGRGGWVITINLDHLRRCEKQPSYAELVRSAEVVVADGMPLVWAAKLQGTPLPERVAGSDLVSTIAQHAAAHGRSIYLLGGNPGTADAAADVLKERHTELTIAGTHCPPFGFEKDETEMNLIRDLLAEAQPDIVYVALGSPKQELLIQQIRNTIPRAWWLGIGISFSFLSGEVKRAPKWMQKLGIEWVHRLIQEPGRLARRYLIEGIPYAIKLMCSSLLRRFRS